MKKHNRMTMSFTRMRDSLDPVKNKRTILIDTIGSGLMFSFFSCAILLGIENEAAIAMGDVISHNDYVITYGISTFMGAIGAFFGYIAGRSDVKRGVEEASRNLRIFEEEVREKEQHINGRNLPADISFDLESAAVKKVLIKKDKTLNRGEFVAIPVQSGFMTDCVTGVVSLERGKNGNPYGYRYDPMRPKDALFDVYLESISPKARIVDHEQNSPRQQQPLVRKLVPEHKNRSF